MRFVRSAAMVIPALAAFLPAQSMPELVGLAATGTGTSTISVLVRQDFQSCATSACAASNLNATTTAAGGTAYDATVGGTWATDGFVLTCIAATSCNTICPPQAVPVATSTFCTGLAVQENAGEMLLIDSGNNIHRYRLGCPINTLVASCSLTGVIPATHTVAGLACDDVNDLVFYSASDFSGGPANNTVFVARRLNICAPVCRFTVVDCSGAALAPLTGLAFDPCRNVIWATDGVNAVAYRVGSNCQVQQVQCCTLALSPGYVGLCIRPSQASSTGQSCTNLGCASCTSMAHVTAGDAAIGNPSFSLDLINAPTNAMVAMFINAGPCTPPGFNLTPFCAPLLVPFLPLPVVVGAFSTGGSGACGGQVNIAVPVPLDPAICGAVLSSQYVGLCTTSGTIGTLVSNCLTFAISGT